MEFWTLVRLHRSKHFWQAVLLLGFLLVAPLAYGQNQRVTLTGNNLTLRAAFEQVERQTSLSVDYDARLIDVKKVLASVPAPGTVSEVMTKLLEGTGFTFAIKGAHIVISRQKSGGREIRTVSGRVLDEKGAPIVGANVIVKGTNTGTSTGSDGRFTLNVPADGRLLFTFLGYVPQEIEVGSRTVIDIRLKEESVAMEDVVVVGYGVQKKVNLSGSVASVDMENLGETRAITNMSQSLQGVMSGVLSQQSSGQPGAESTSITIRGQGTLNNSSPLVVVDGIVGSLSDVAPSDVASISVLKDAASSSIYGSRAANGVILVTTKQGSKDKIRVTYNTYLGSQRPTFNIDVVDDYALYMETINKALNRAGQPSAYKDDIIAEWRANSPLDPEIYPNTNWFREVYKSAFIQEHTLQASGSSGKVDYMISVGYLGNNGSMPETDYEKYSFRSNVNAQVTPWLKVGTKVSGYRSIRENADVSAYMGYVSNSSPGTLPRSSDGRLGAEWAPGGNQQANNVFANFDETDDMYYTTRVLGTLSATVSFTKNLTWHNSVNVTFDNSFENIRQQPVKLWNLKENTVVRTAGASRTTLKNDDNRYYRLIVDSYLNYSLPINAKHQLDFILGYNQEYEESSNTIGTAYDLLSYDTDVMNSAASPSTIKGGFSNRALRSGFGRINYNFDDKYLLEANLRYDGSSKFAKGHRWGLFPSFSGAWRISKENFMKDIGWLDNLKLRLSWGTLGNNRTDDYGTQSIYKSANAVLAGQVTTGAAMTNLVNRNLTWESTAMTNVGIDFDVLGGRLGFVGDFFYKKTKDILLQLPVPLVLGGLSAPYQNAGIVSNRGVELNIRWNDAIRNKFRYGISANYTFVRSKVDRYRGEVATYSGQRILLEGIRLYPFYVREVECIATQDKIDEMLANGYKFYPSTPKPGDFIYKDQQQPGEPGYKIINDDDRVIKGNSVPEHYFGLTLNAEWKGIDFSALFQGVAGVHKYLNSMWYTNVLKNGSQINKKFLNAWSEENPTSNIPAVTTDDGGRNTANNDFWLQDASYLRLKNIQIGYTFPAKWTRKFVVQRLRIYCSAENLFTITGFEGLDPELSGADAYPNMKRIVGGISITF